LSLKRRAQRVRAAWLSAYWPARSRGLSVAGRDRDFRFRAREALEPGCTWQPARANARPLRLPAKAGAQGKLSGRAAKRSAYSEEVSAEALTQTSKKIRKPGPT